MLVVDTHLLAVALEKRGLVGQRREIALLLLESRLLAGQPGERLLGIAVGRVGDSDGGEDACTGRFGRQFGLELLLGRAEERAGTGDRVCQVLHLRLERTHLVGGNHRLDGVDLRGEGRD